MIALILAAGLEVFPVIGDTAVSARSTRTIAGFPIEAEVEGYTATFGGGLLDAAGQRLPGSPDIVTKLERVGNDLIARGPRGKYKVEGGQAALIEEPGLRDGHIIALAKAGDTLWIATFDGGLSSYNNGTWRHFTEGDGLPSDWLDDLAWDGEKLWAVGDKGVFWVIDGMIERPKRPELRRPGSALFFYKGVMHVAQEKALVLVTGQELDVLPVPEKNPQDLWVDESGIWLAGLEGLYRFKDRKMGFYHGGRGLPANWVTAVTRAPEGIVAGTYDQGLSTLKGERLLPDAWINLKALASQGDFLAAGGMEEGLWLRQGKEWTRLRRGDGLPGEDVSALLFDGDALWIGTRSGLARLDLAAWRPAVVVR